MTDDSCATHMAVITKGPAANNMCASNSPHTAGAAFTAAAVMIIRQLPQPLHHCTAARRAPLVTHLAPFCESGAFSFILAQ